MNTQLDRIETRIQSIDDRTRAIEIRLGAMTGEKEAEEKAHHWIGGVLKHGFTLLLAALAGLAGSHTSLPGGH